MIEIDRAGKRIHLTSPYDPRTIAGCKRVGGANWSKTAKAWTFPLTIESCIRLRQEFGSSLKIKKALSQWYREEAARREALAALGSGSAAADLPRVKDLAPFLWEAVTIARPYQSLGARFIVEGREVLIADDPGLGKTLEALAGIVESGVPGPYLVVSPKTAATTVWPREIPRWLPDHRVIDLPEGRAKRDDILGKLQDDYVDGEDLSNTWVSVHPEAISTKSYWVCDAEEEDIAGTAVVCGYREPYTTKPTSVLGCGHPKTKKTSRIDEHTFPQLFGITWGAIIVDECHESLVRKSGKPTQRRRGLELLTSREGGLRIAVSGTPFRNKPWQLWGILNWLRPSVYTGFWRWAEQYWSKGGYSGWEIGSIIEEREAMLWGELNGIVLRRTKAEVAGDLPPKTYVGTPLDPSDEDSPVGIWLPMGSKQGRIYQQMLNQSAAELEGGTLRANGTLAELTRLSQFATACGEVRGVDADDFFPNPPSNKMDWLEEFLEELGIPGEPTGKVVVVSRFTKMLNMLSFGLAASQGGMSCMLTGDISGVKRQRIIDSFNQPVGSDSPHVMFLQVKAGGVAITIDSADDMVMIDESDPDTMIQVEDRIHRVSNPRPVRYHYLRSVGTTDVGVALVNAERAAQGRRVLDERRGVKYFREVLEASRG